ncbi:MAG: protein-export chaperone SecB [Rickettsiales bacterium]|jgi:protein-export chaperone SecB|nr:protein-export chaperone SecB [Rickettsiales bacterium]
MAEYKLISDFLKSISFNSPSVPELFFKNENTQAKMDINIDIQIKSSENKLFMVDLLTKLHSKLDGDKTVFMIDSVYSAVVQVEKNENEEDLKHTLLVDVPTQIFPNIWTLVLHLTTESGFPPFKMNMVDFEKLYKEKNK